MHQSSWIDSSQEEEEETDTDDDIFTVPPVTPGDNFDPNDIDEAIAMSVQFATEDAFEEYLHTGGESHPKDLDAMLAHPEGAIHLDHLMGQEAFRIQWELPGFDNHGIAVNHARVRAERLRQSRPSRAQVESAYPWAQLGGSEAVSEGVRRLWRDRTHTPMGLPETFEVAFRARHAEGGDYLDRRRQVSRQEFDSIHGTHSYQGQQVDTRPIPLKKYSHTILMVSDETIPVRPTSSLSFSRIFPFPPGDPKWDHLVSAYFMGAK